MAIIFFDGFEKYGPSCSATLAGLTGSTENFSQNGGVSTTWLPYQSFTHEWFTFFAGNTSGSPAIGTITGRSGGSTIALGMHCDGNNALAIYRNLGANPARIIVGFAIMVSLVGQGGVQFDDGQVGTQCSVWIDATGHVNFSRSIVGGANVLFTSTQTITANTWHYLEVDVTINNPSGGFTIWLDGVQITSNTFQSSQNTRAQTNNFVNRLSFSTSNTNGANLAVDDIYCFDTSGTTNNAARGDSVVDTLSVRADSSIQFTPNLVIGNISINNGQSAATVINTIYLIPVTPSVNCTINSVSFLAQQFALNLNFKAALVSSVAGVPTILLAQGTNVGNVLPATIQTNTPLTLPFSVGQSLTAGTQYFIGMFMDTATTIQISDRFNNTGQRIAYTFTTTNLSTPAFNTGIGNFTYTNSNLTATRTAANAGVQRHTKYQELGYRGSGLLYFEAAVSTWSNNSWGAGVANVSSDTTAGLGANGNSFGAYFSSPSNGFFEFNGAFTNNQWTSTAPVATNAICFAVDFTHGKIWVRLNNGGWNASAGGTQDPATNQGGFSISALLAVPVVPAFGDGFNGSIQGAAIMHTSSGSFSFSPPSGFTAWDSATQVLTAATTGQNALTVWGNCTSPASNFPVVSQVPLPIAAGQTFGYVSSATVNQEDLYTPNGMTFDPQSIAGVKVSVAAQKSVGGSRTFDIRLKSGTADNAGSNPAISPGTSTGWFATYFATDPDTNLAWGTSKVNAAKIGFKIVS